jgi:hypothetical protein
VGSITLLILGTDYALLNTMGEIGLYMVVLFAVWSAVEYFRTFWSNIDDRMDTKRDRRRHILLKKRSPRRHAPTP